MSNIPVIDNPRKNILLFVTNVDWFFVSHRLVIAEKAMNNGFEVIVAAEDTGSSAEFTSKGIHFVKLSFSRSGINPLKELTTIIEFYKLYNRIKPDIIHHITLKPVIYGSLIAKMLKIKNIVNAVSGLGYNFTANRRSLVSTLMIRLLKLGFDKNYNYIFQNKDDFEELAQLKVIKGSSNINFVKGSGVNLRDFYLTEPLNTGKIRFVLASRMIEDKGIREFHEAACLLKNRFHDKIEFVLAGMIDTGNKSGISARVLEDWGDGDYFRWLGHTSKVFDLYSRAHVVVLPSYREGIPKALIEACAMGRAIITTTAIGCRECVDEGVNGYKVPIRDAQSLATAMETFVKNPEKIVEMGIESRKKAEKEFDIEIVIKAHLDIYNKLIMRRLIN
ncbi:MAG: glycosyltransferase family 4 protein [Crocinitomicaceae bacterium]|nr:glycosyltransferase family 4 protein [Crocinitomicaceae bacterium]